MKILIVEDDKAISDFLIRGLREEGYIVEHCADGNLALSKLALEKWDAILMDWWLPGVDGLTLVKRVRESGDLTPILFLTARDAVSNRIQGLDGGADDYLCKPFSFQELLARLRVLLRRNDQRPNPILSYADIRYDTMKQQVERGGVRIDLTAKEQALLLYFLRHPDTVLSRTRLYEQVWDDRYDGISNTLVVHVMELRRKLELQGPRLIHTVRGKGYLFSTTARE
jgi:two-component system copper resistance phosphate regulon response regulator CusR